MRFKQINEGVQNGELKSLVRPYVSVAEFEPKTGNENDVVVIGFYCRDEFPAKDLSRFIERGITDVSFFPRMHVCIAKLNNMSWSPIV